MTIWKFEHLHDIDLTPENIKKLNPEEIKPKHLPKLKAMFDWYKEKSSNPEVVLASNNILWQIDAIMNLWKNNFSWEVIRATADDYNYSMTG